MGCWNETCGLTQHTIKAGEPVYAVVILNNNYVGKACYGNGLSSPMSLVIEGYYNDYGSIVDVVDNFAAQSTIKLFNQFIDDNKLILSEEFTKDVERQYTDYTMTDKNHFTNIEGLFYAIERGYVRLKTSGFSGEAEQSINFMLFGKDELESAWESLNYATGYEIENDTWEVCNDDIQTWFDTFDGEDPMLTKLGIREELKKEGLTAEEKDELYDLLFTFSERNKPWGGDNLKSKYSEWGNSLGVFTRYETVDTNSFRKINTIVTNAITNGDDLEDIKSALATMLMTTSVFSAFRKSWAPQGHSTQWDSFDLVLDYTERSLRKMYKKRQEMVDDGYYEDGFPDVVGAIPIFEEGKMK